ncbi:MAG: hypothetical protein Ta2E_13240 [Mycoplasmoidaceae bacterium]|nr:MAG: hypothetical protein Ta2E_13240 [Mycoplasmoidaceae bacterium]
MYNKIKVFSLESYEDKSFFSKKVLSYFISCYIVYYIITEQKHKSLTMVYRFIKSIRDWYKNIKPVNNIKIKSFIDT